MPPPTMATFIRPLRPGRPRTAGRPPRGPAVPTVPGPRHADGLRWWPWRPFGLAGRAVEQAGGACARRTAYGTVPAGTQAVREAMAAALPPMNQLLGQKM